MSRRPPRLNKDTMHCQGGVKKPKRCYKLNSYSSNKIMDYQHI
jgi:hypothetical protein